MGPDAGTGGVDAVDDGGGRVRPATVGSSESIPYVADRLSSLNASFLYLEEPTTAMHVGSVMIFAPLAGRSAEPFDYDRLLALVTDRIERVPRYRQRVRYVPGRLANPVWVDDEDFDPTYHVRRSALPRPGTDEQLQELAARVESRPLDRARPLWEAYLVEGLQDGRFAIITKTHQAMVDGREVVDLAQLLLEPDTAVPPVASSITATASRSPNDLELLADAVIDVVRRPSQAIDNLRGGLADVRGVGTRATGVARGVISTLARTAASPAPASPLNATIGAARRYAMVTTDLADYRAVRDHINAQIAGGLAASADSAGAHQVSVNDVVLATVAGALRAFLLMRGEPVHTATAVRAMVPVSVSDDGGEDRADQTPPGSPRLDRLVACFVDLPVGEPSPGMRVRQVAYAMRQQTHGGRALGAASIAGIAGFAPPTLHSLGVQLAGAASRRLFNLVVTNVPGPQEPRYAAGAQLLSTHPVIPLAPGQALAIGLTSYDGGVYYGLNADRDAMSDVDVLGQCLTDALDELVHSREGTQ